MSIRQRKTIEKGSIALTGAAETVEQKIEQSLLAIWEELPTWQQDNHYILTGYRRASNSYRTSLASLTYAHNESVNIYSHLIGALLALASGLVLLLYYSSSSSSSLLLPSSFGGADALAFACFFVGAATCLSMSATYHTISNHSPTVARLGNQLDYAGIVLLIWGSFVASIYYGFACHSHLRLLYWKMISVLGLGCIVVSIRPKFRSPRWRPYRAAMFVSMGLFAVVPILQGWRLYGIDRMKQEISLDWLVLQGALYILGAAIYAAQDFGKVGHADDTSNLFSDFKARVPERFMPGTFDIWGSSHQMFHLLVLMAASAHLIGLIKAFNYRHDPLRPSC